MVERREDAHALDLGDSTAPGLAWMSKKMRGSLVIRRESPISAIPVQVGGDRRAAGQHGPDSVPGLASGH
jgi:hypothetical protein